MQHRTRVLALIGMTVLGALVVALLVAGLRTRAATDGSAGAPAPLARPRFSVAPRLELPVLRDPRTRGPLRAAWRAAAADGVVSLGELRGRPVVVNFWASWCDPCRREAPMLEAAWRRGRGRVVVLGIDQNDARDDALGFIRRFGLRYGMLREPGDATAVRWGIRGFPVTFFVSKTGRVVAEAIGQLHPGQLQRGIRAAERGRL